MRSSSPLVLAAIPIAALIGALPFVNRIEPVVLGLPFVLSWILGWVLLTPVFLGAAYLITRPGAEAPGPTTAGGGSATTPGDGRD